MITRTFHPVGQGAFYSERHENYNIVYDCGELYNRKSAKSVVKQAFNGEVIDILFISHFDYDHISLIDILKEKNEIRNVVVPLTTKEGIALSIASCLKSDKSVPATLIQLITSTKEYFGENTKLIQVSRNNGNELNTDTNAEPLTIGLQDITINSGTKISIGGNVSAPTDVLEPVWCFIPYNIQFDVRAKLLCNLLEKAGLDYGKMTDLQYIKDNLSAIKSCYNSLPEGANGNSMMVYSGPYRKWNDESHPHHFWFDHPYYYSRHHYYPVYEERIACLYTGDVNLNDVNLNNINSQIKDFIGTVQVPHHGSVHSFNKNNFCFKHAACPISFGNNNCFGHPSGKVMDSLLRNECTPISITNDLESTYIQIIR